MVLEPGEVVLEICSLHGLFTPAGDLSNDATRLRRKRQRYTFCSKRKKEKKGCYARDHPYLKCCFLWTTRVGLQGPTEFFFFNFSIHSVYPCQKTIKKANKKYIFPARLSSCFFGPPGWTGYDFSPKTGLILYIL